MIDRMLIHTCEIRPYLRQGAGGPLYGAPEIRHCRMEPGTNAKIVYKNPSGAITETAASLLMFCTGEPIAVNSAVIWNGREMRVIKCQVMYGMGMHHLEVYLE